MIVIIIKIIIVITTPTKVTIIKVEIKETNNYDDK